MRRVALALALLASALACAAPVDAQQAPQLSMTVIAPEPIPPGGNGEGSATLKYCFNSGPNLAAHIELQADDIAWASMVPEPSSFDVPGSNGCGATDVALHASVTRAAPAFEPGALSLHARASNSAGRSSTADVDVYVQANYWAELRAAPPARPRIPQGDSGQLVLKFTVGANDGTRIEALGSDPTGKLTMVGRLIDSTAGHGLDELDERSETFTVAVSPGAAVGINRFDVKLSTHYAKRPDLVGEAVTVPVEVDVTKASGGGGNLLPGFEALAAAGALAGLGLGLARRGKP